MDKFNAFGLEQLQENLFAAPDIKRMLIVFAIYMVVFGGIVEIIRPVVKRRKYLSVKKSFRLDVMHFFLTRIITTFIAGFMAFGLAYLAANTAVMQPIVSWVQAQSLWFQVPVALLMIMFLDYWDHRTAHEWRWRWRFHGVHHSSREMDWIAATRLHPVDQSIHRSITYAFTFMWGFSVEAFLIAFAIMGFQAILVHSNIKLSFGPLNYLIASPQVHHWHHAEDPVNKNYGAFSPLMDVIFGTYYCPKGEWPKSYGIRAPLEEKWIDHMLTPFGYKGMWKRFYQQVDEEEAATRENPAASPLETNAGLVAAGPGKRA